MKVIILRGLPGAGKTTLARERWPRAKLVSADDFFERGGRYHFDAAQIQAAHADCFARFLRACDRGYDEIVTHNTAIHAWEIAPYVLGAQACGYDDICIITLRCDVPTAIARNVHHVPRATIERMARDLHREQLPPHWRHTEEAP